MRRKWSVTILVTVLVVLIVMAVADLSLVHGFQKPLFARPAETMDDGGSGLYKGLGYSIRIEGNFLPEEELPGVTQYEYRVFGLLISAGIRD